MKSLLLKLFGSKKKRGEKYCTAGLDLYSLGKFKEGVKLCTKAISINQTDGRAYNSRGFGYRELKEYSKAMSDFNKAIEINPNDELVYYNRGRIYDINLRDSSNAILNYTKAVELDPSWYSVYHYRGCIHFELKDYINAVFDFSKVIELKPNFVLAYMQRGNSYNALNDYSNAISDYTKVIEKNPNDAETYNKRGRAYFELGDENNGNKDVQRAKFFAQKAETVGIEKYEMIEEFFEDLNEYWRFFMNKRELSKETPCGKCTATLSKEEDGKWQYILEWWEDGKFCGENVRPFRANEENLRVFNKGCAEVARRLRIYLETKDFSKVPMKPPAFGRLSCESSNVPEPIRERNPNEKYFPAITSSKLVKRFNAGIYEFVLITDVKAMGIIQYSHILTAYIKGNKEPSFVVASEISNQEEPGSKYRFLGGFSGEGHNNYGSSEEWSDLTLFEKKAREIMSKELGVEIV
jgi:tetratricopeptide (TPR) repeat protein